MTRLMDTWPGYQKWYKSTQFVPLCALINMTGSLDTWLGHQNWYWSPQATIFHALFILTKALKLVLKVISGLVNALVILTRLPTSLLKMVSKAFRALIGALIALAKPPTRPSWSFKLGWRLVHLYCRDNEFWCFLLSLRTFFKRKIIWGIKTKVIEFWKMIMVWRKRW